MEGSNTGLWTGGCGVDCPLRAAVLGTLTGLRPGQLVLDVGSGCGLYSEWLYEWFGARSIGLDFVEAAVEFAQKKVASKAPAAFCWLDIARSGLGFIPAGSVDLA